MKLFKLALSSAVGSLALACCLCLAHSGVAQEPKAAPADAGPAKDRIEIKDFMFKPATLSVPAGTKVTFINRDEEPHTVTSKDGKFTKSKPLDTDQEFSVTLTAPGQYVYFCSVHPQMTGTITVTAP